MPCCWPRAWSWWAYPWTRSRAAAPRPRPRGPPVDMAAGQAAGAGKAAARQAVEADLAEVEAVLAELATLRDQAAKAKVPEAVLADVEGAATAVREGMREGEGRLEQGDLLAAQALAAE